MRITELITEQSLDELSLAGVGQGIKKAAGAVGRGIEAGAKGLVKGAGYVAGAPGALKTQYQAGKQSAVNRLGAAGQQSANSAANNAAPIAGTPNVTASNTVAPNVTANNAASRTTPNPTSTNTVSPAAQGSTTASPNSTPAAPGATAPVGPTNPFLDARKLAKDFNNVAQQLSAAQATQLKPTIKNIYQQLGGTAESAVNNKPVVVEFYSNFLGKQI